MESTKATWDLEGMSSGPSFRLEKRCERLDTMQGLVKKVRLQVRDSDLDLIQLAETVWLNVSY